ncbi:hypothetical protein [Streptomyces sp. NPDC053755]|uniref:hypothetical protein n=1 Tax=Streptomyces sp. NPDC053755 TaxID=3155815 RepID=UPI003412E5C2
MERHGHRHHIQCHLQLLAVEEFSLTAWDPPAHSASFDAKPLEEHRVRVRVTGSGVDLGFTSSASVMVGHVSAFKLQDGADGGRHVFSQELDSLCKVTGWDFSARDAAVTLRPCAREGVHVTVEATGSHLEFTATASRLTRHAPI